MRVVLLQPLTTTDGSLAVGANEEFADDVAIRLVEKGIVKPKNKKEYERLKLEVEEAKQAQEELKVKAIASLEQDKIKESATLLREELKDTLELVIDKEFCGSFSRVTHFAKDGEVIHHTLSDALPVMDGGGYGWSVVDGLKVDLADSLAYHELLEELSICTEKEDFVRVTKKYLNVTE